MKRKFNNKGVSLIELLVVIGIMVVLTAVLAPLFVKYIDRAKQVKVEKEASEFVKSAQLAFVEVAMTGQSPKSDSIKNRTEKSSPYYKNGTKYGNVTNWTVHNGVVKTASNAPFAEKLFELLNISIGKEWQSDNATIPISTSQPKMNPAGSMTDECIFQLFYDSNGNIIVEYSRKGYFVRVENSTVVESVKVKNSTDKHFTSWQ